MTVARRAARELEPSSAAGDPDGCMAAHRPAPAAPRRPRPGRSARAARRACWPCPSRPGPSPSPALARAQPSAARSSSPCRPPPRPSAWPTTSAAYLGADEVELFPAWETLPFERVSPSVETMGRRLRAMWRLRDPERAPAVVVAPVRALVQRLGPHVEDVEPVVVRPGEQARPRRARRAARRRRLPARVPGRAPGRGRGAGLDRRRLPVDRRPPGAHRPVGRRGRPAHRVLASADQRSTDDVDDGRDLPVPRAAAHRRGPRAGRRRSSRTEPWGREQWERLAEGLTFDGMESWLPWLADGEHLLLDLAPPDGSGAAGRAPAHARPGRRHPRRGGRPRRAPGPHDLGRRPTAPRFPALHLPFDRLLSHTEAPALDGRRRARRARRRHRRSRPGWDPVVGDGAGLVEQLTELLGRRLPGRGRRRRRGLGRTASRRERARAADGRSTPDDRRRRAARAAASSCPRVKLAVLAEADLTGRRRAHRRRPAPPDATAPGFFDDLKPGDYVVHHQHGVARYGGMVKRAIGGVERDYLLLEYRGDDKLYVPSDQIDAVRHYTGGETPSLVQAGRRRLAEDEGPGAHRGRRDRPGAGGALPEAACTRPGTPSRPTRRGSASWRRRSRTRRRPTSSRPSTT